LVKHFTSNVKGQLNYNIIACRLKSEPSSCRALGENCGEKLQNNN
jgi:hypothetical protein